MPKKIENWKLGTDPEVLLMNKDTKEVESAIGIVGGTKYEPMDIGEGCALQEDNVMCEFCVPPTNNVEDMWKSIQYVLNYINEKLASKNLVYLIKPSAFFKKEQLDNFQAQQFGCEPDFNFWTLMMNEPAMASPDLLLRSAGGHVHLGYDNPNMDTNIEILRAMDLFLGVPSILMDNDTERRKLYGNAGCFREKPYGVEYRVLSNFWIASKENVQWVFDAVTDAIDFVNNNQTIDEDTAKEIQECINTANKELAEKIVEKFKLKTLVLV